MEEWLDEAELLLKKTTKVGASCMRNAMSINEKLEEIYRTIEDIIEKNKLTDSSVRKIKHSLSSLESVMGNTKYQCGVDMTDFINKVKELQKLDIKDLDDIRYLDSEIADIFFDLDSYLSEIEHDP